MLSTQPQHKMASASGNDSTTKEVTTKTATISNEEAVQIARMRQNELENIEKNILDLQSGLEEHKFEFFCCFVVRFF
jgi:Zn-dependent metalloprotease